MAPSISIPTNPDALPRGNPTFKLRNSLIQAPNCAVVVVSCSRQPLMSGILPAALHVVLCFSEYPS
ncbi:hypothetical protein D3C71_925590 [compost metagenome]